MLRFIRSKQNAVFRVRLPRAPHGHQTQARTSPLTHAGRRYAVEAGLNGSLVDKERSSLACESLPSDSRLHS